MTYKENFINKAELIYNNKYDYTLVEYVNQHTPVNIGCSIHGIFTVTPHSHIHQRRECSLCKKSDKELTLEKFIQKANELHGNKYDYSKSVLTNLRKHLIVICPNHGEWLVTPSNHLHKNIFGCPKCGKESSANKRRKTTEQWIEEAALKHGSKYDYSKSVYTGAHNKLTVICKEHGEWEVTASNHSNNGSTCPTCAQISRTFSSFEEFIEEYLIENKLFYMREKSFPDLINPKTGMNLYCDFYLPHNNLVIEYDGEHHFKPVQYGKVDKFKLLKYTKYKDSIKNEYCKNNSINLLRIPYTIDTKSKIIATLKSYFTKNLI